MLKLDFSGQEAFSACLDGDLALEAALDHPAYQVIRVHSQRFGTPIGQIEVEQALLGQERLSTCYCVKWKVLVIIA